MLDLKNIVLTCLNRHAAIETQRKYSLVVYFYCSMRDNDSSRRKPEDIMRSLLKALLVESGTNPEVDIPDLYQRYQSRAEDGDLSMEETCTFISRFLGRRFDCPRIFIDALDEVDRADRFTLFKHLFELLHRTNLKVWVSSRAEDDIKLMMNKNRGPEVLGAVNVGNDNMGDIGSYVQREINAAIADCRLLRGAVDDGLRKLIIQRLIEKSEGM